MSSPVTSAEWAARCADDGEFGLAARHWTGGLRLEIGDHVIAVMVTDGQVTAAPEPSTGAPDGPGHITISGPAETWEPVLRTVPPRYFNDIHVACNGLGLERHGDPLLWWQYVPAIQRAVELLRAPGVAAPATVHETGPLPRFDSPVGRYVHLELDDHDHRVYFEEAGSGTRPVRTVCSGGTCSSGPRSPTTSGSSRTTFHSTENPCRPSTSGGGKVSTS